MTTLSYNDSKIMITILENALKTDKENEEKIKQFLDEFTQSVKEFAELYHMD